MRTIVKAMMVSRNMLKRIAPTLGDTSVATRRPTGAVAAADAVAAVSDELATLPPLVFAGEVDNLRERLALHHGASARLRVYESDGEFVAQVSVPLKRKAATEPSTLNDAPRRSAS